MATLSARLHEHSSDIRACSSSGLEPASRELLCIYGKRLGTQVGHLNYLEPRIWTRIGLMRSEAAARALEGSR